MIETSGLIAQLGIVGVVLTAMAYGAKILINVFERITRLQSEMVEKSTEAMKEVSENNKTAAESSKAAAETSHRTMIEAREIVRELRAMHESRHQEKSSP